MTSPDRKSSEIVEQNTIPFHYVKSNFFRVVHGDGVYGGVTPRGLLAMNFFSERLPIVERMVYRVDEGGVLGEEVRLQRMQKDGVVREIEVEVMLDLANTEALIAWLGDRVTELRQLQRPNAS